MAYNKENPVSTNGLKQTYFILPKNIEKLKQIKQATNYGYSDIINKLIEEKYSEIFKEKKYE